MPFFPWVNAKKIKFFKYSLNNKNDGVLVIFSFLLLRPSKSSGALKKDLNSGFLTLGIGADLYGKSVLYLLLCWCSSGPTGFFAEQPKCQKEIHIFFCVAPMHCGDNAYTFRVLGIEKVLFMGAKGKLNCTSSDMMAPPLVLL